MSAHRPEVADVFRQYTAAYIGAYGKATSREQLRVLKDLICCRTAALGGHVGKCDNCGHTEHYYNSCRNRHCPKCRAAARAKWLSARAADLLDVGYFHVVFTLPDTLGPIALQNKRPLYEIVFRAVSETLHTIAKEPKHLGAEIGFIAILHTWGQTLQLHPHIHCVIPAGGLSPDGKEWVSCREDFFLPVRVLSKLFQKKLLAYLQEACESGKLRFHGKQEHLQEKANWKSFISGLYDAKWVVYSKPPFGGPKQVLKYLARYTHRVAISNQRLISAEQGKVSFRYKDYADSNKQKIMTLDALEFIRRFLLHVLPSGFVRIRHFGFLSNRSRKEKLPVCRELIAGVMPPPPPPAAAEAEEIKVAEISKYPTCPCCRRGRMVIIGRMEPDASSCLFPTVDAYNTS